MKKRHSAREITDKLSKIDELMDGGKSLPDAIKIVDINEPTYSRWKNKYGSTTGDQTSYIQGLEQQIDRLKRAVTNLTMENLDLKEAAEQRRPRNPARSAPNAPQADHGAGQATTTTGKGKLFAVSH